MTKLDDAKRKYVNAYNESQSAKSLGAIIACQDRLAMLRRSIILESIDELSDSALEELFVTVLRLRAGGTR